MYRFHEDFTPENTPARALSGAVSSEIGARMPWGGAAPLTVNERRVALLSRNDAPPAGPVRARFDRVAGVLFGRKPVTTLADPKLEALRQFAIQLRLSDGHPPKAAIEAFQAVGFAPDHIEPVYRLCRETNARRLDRGIRLRRRIIAALIWAAVLPPVAIAISDHLGDPMMGLLGATMLLLLLAPMAARALAITPHTAR